MKIIVVSDTHGNCDNLVRVMETEKRADLLIHLGDLLCSPEEIKEIAGCPAQIIAGNNDFFSALDREKEFEIEGYKIFMTHGHKYQVGLGTSYLRDVAHKKGADIVMYGHTHRPEVSFYNQLMILNPGSLTSPRQEGRMPSYITLWLDAKKGIDYDICYLDKLYHQKSMSIVRTSVKL
ncbi:putative phosphoesterase [Lachnospiraceae bacterium TWA4]|nr:putative phosphoesterase [Lachnospiraceae bacterium TWA4]